MLWWSEIVPLTLASGEYLRENGFLHQRGALYIAREGDEELVTDFMQRFVPTGATISISAVVTFRSACRVCGTNGRMPSGSLFAPISTSRGCTRTISPGPVRLARCSNAAPGFAG